MHDTSLCTGAREEEEGMIVAAATVFVSDSQLDREALEQLAKFVRPLERQGALTFWSDIRIEAGRDGKAESLAALEQARVAVLSIAADFLASDFIAEEEIPRILARAHDHSLVVLPVFLRHSLVAALSFSFVHVHGQQHRDTLTRFQGVGRPDKPLSELTWSEVAAGNAAELVAG